MGPSDDLIRRTRGRAHPLRLECCFRAALRREAAFAARQDGDVYSGKAEIK